MSMDKLLEIPAFDRFGEPNTRILPRMSAAVFEKTAGSLPVEVKAYLEKLTPDPDLLYLLIVALGAADFWGSNVNGDAFFEKDLLGIQTPMEAGRNPPPYSGVPLPRYNTFCCAHVFKHHVNKDPLNSFGKVALPVYDHPMHRVLLVVGIDKKKAPDIVSDIEKNGSVVWSMGTKVPYDECLPAGTLIRTSDGYLPIELIKEGMKVRTHSGKLGSVTHTIKNPANELLELDISGIGQMKMTANHPVLVVRKTDIRGCRGTVNGNPIRHTFDLGSTTCTRCGEQVSAVPQWVKSEEIAVGDYLVSPTAKEHKSLGNMCKALLLGYYLGDGFIIKQRTKKDKSGDYRDMGVGFSIGSGDQELISKICGCLVETCSNEPHIYAEGDKKAVSIRVYDQDLATFMKQHGGKYCDQKHLSEEVFGWSAQEIRSVIDGYITTDGSTDETKGSTRISTINRGLALDVLRLADSIGVRCAVSFAGTSNAFGNAEAGKDQWYICFPKTTKSNMTFNGSWALRPVKAIVQCEAQGEVYNLSVEGDESYIAEGLAVHNCSICHHRSKTVSEYCEHLKTAMNQTWENGHKVYAINSMPRFFDISRVLIPADKTAMTLMKVASGEGKTITIGDDGTGCGTYSRCHETLGSAVIAERVKVAQAKAAGQKEGEIKKEVPVHTIDSDLSDDAAAARLKKVREMGTRMRKLANAEPAIPSATLDQLSLLPLCQALSSMASVGMVATPSEFSKLVIAKYAQKCADKDLRAFVDPGAVNNTAVELLLPYLADRSALSPWIDARLEKVSNLVKKAEVSLPVTFVTLYEQYRNSLMSWDVDVSRRTIVKHAHNLAETRTASAVEMAQAMLGSGLTKVSGIKIDAALAGTGLTGGYLASAHEKIKEERKGQQLNLVQKLVSKHPLPLGAAAAAAAILGAHKLRLSKYV
jgi:hypothetical protein